MAIELAHIVPDTNQALHFQRLDQIDWCSLENAKACIIYIAPTYLRELENEKVFNKFKRLRDRAGATIRWLAELADLPDPIELRPGVELKFIDHEPLIDLAAHRLSDRVADDLFLATALEIASEVSQPVSIASGDSGMKVKTRSRSELTFLALPDDLKLSVEEDPEQKELREARAELVRLKTKQPKLVASFVDEKSFTKVRLGQVISSVPSLSDIKEQHPLRPIEQHPQEDSPGIDFALSSNFAGRLNETHNARLEEYYAAYEEYLRRSAQHDAFWSRTFDAQFKVSNEGKAPASEVDVIFEFPEFVTLLETSDLPKTPKAPDPPRRGTSLLMPSRDYLEGIAPFPHINANPDGQAYIRKASNSVEYSVRKLKHGFNYQLERIYISFKPGAEIKSFQVPWYAHCNEGDPEEGSVNFIVEQTL